MSLPDENILMDLAKKFKIAQNIPADEHIQLLKNLEKLEPERLCAVLNYFLTLETNRDVLIYLIKIVSKYPNDLTVDILSDMLLSTISDTSESNTKYKIEIVNALGRSKNSTCVVSLLYVLNNKNENYKVRLACAEALGRIGSSYAVTPLIDVVTDNEEKSVYLRESAAKALGMLGNIEAIEPLANIIENKNGLFDKFTFLKERVVETLGKLGQYGDEKSIKALKIALQDDAACVRISAIEALSEIDDDMVIPLIEGMLDDQSEDVARCAIFTLYEILGKDYVISLQEAGKLQECCIDEIRELLEDDIEVESNEE